MYLGTSDRSRDGLSSRPYSQGSDTGDGGGSRSIMPQMLPRRKAVIFRFSIGHDPHIPYYQGYGNRTRHHSTIPTSQPSQSQNSSLPCKSLSNSQSSWTTAPACWRASPMPSLKPKSTS